jgi:hypothetical protein
MMSQSCGYQEAYFSSNYLSIEPHWNAIDRGKLKSSLSEKNLTQ